MNALAQDPPAGRRPRTRRDRALGTAFSVAAHLSILGALYATWAHLPEQVEPAPIAVALIHLPPPEPTPEPAKAPAAPEPAPVKAAPPPVRARPTPPPPAHVETRPATPARIATSGPGLTEAQLAGALTAGSGSGSGSGVGAGGQPCDMVRLLQSKLRNDPLVQAAVAGSAGKAIMVWDGDWVRDEEEDGKGLAAVREAIMWEVAFAPKACRAEAVHGLVLISLNERGSTRLAVGSRVWRWSDLLTPRRAYVATP